MLKTDKVSKQTADATHIRPVDVPTESNEELEWEDIDYNEMEPTFNLDEDGERNQEIPEEVVLASVPDAYARPTWFFDVPDSVVRPTQVFDCFAIHPLVQILLLLVCWMHLFYHLSHRGAHLILQVTCLLFKEQKLIGEDDELVSLTTAISTLGLDDNFFVLPMCTECGQIVPQDASTDSKCPVCSSPMFARKHTLWRRNVNEDFKPIRKFPFNPISNQLASLLGREGMEELLDRWRQRERTDEELLDMMDGQIWKTLKAHDNTRFFDNCPSRKDIDELRIGLTLSMDGYVHHLKCANVSLANYLLQSFSHGASKHAGSHSSDVISCSIANLPPQIR